MQVLSKHELTRYSRQIMMPQIGDRGQSQLRNAHVAIAGVGGLGSPVAFYLTAAGIGTITLIDHDVVELSNLNRQILHSEDDFGKTKIASAIGKLQALNSSILIKGICSEIKRENVLNLLHDVDIVVDCLDNFDGRFILNEAILKLHIPCVHGGCHGFDGRVMTIIPGATPCLKCLLPHCPPPQTSPIIGATAGVIGAMQANEVIKILTGNPLLTNKFLLYNGEDLSSCLIEIDKDPMCSHCGGK